MCSRYDFGFGIISFNPCNYLCKVDIIIPILQMWKLSHREIETYARAHSSCVVGPDFESCVRLQS